jgi:hypothetical protein
MKDHDIYKEYFLNEHFSPTERQMMLITEFLYGKNRVETKDLNFKEDKDETQ